MTDAAVLYRADANVATLTLNRPEVLNAMDEALMVALERHLIEIAADATVRAVILTGAGRGFCAGGDQKRDRSREGRERLFDGDPGGHVIDRLNRCILRMQKLPKPIIGAVNGIAVGAGCNLALATDLRIAADTARFGEVFSRVGLTPDGGGTFLLPRLVGPAKALEMFMLGDIIEAGEALRIGLVNRVVPAGELDGAARALATRLAGGPTLAHGLAKRAVYAALNMPLEAALDMEARNQAIAMRSDDHAEGRAAFQEKRQPRFKGR